MATRQKDLIKQALTHAEATPVTMPPERRGDAVAARPQPGRAADGSPEASLQIANEELKTSWEELQSVIEELARVNAELQTKVADLSRANNDMNNLLAGTGIATVFLDRQLRILRFTPAATHIINLIQGDLGRPVSHFVSNLTGYDRLEDDTLEVLDTLVPKEIDVRNAEGRWYLMRILPYRTMDNVIEGAVLTFVDITAARQLQEELRRNVKDLRASQRIAHIGTWHLDVATNEVTWTEELYQMYGFDPSLPPPPYTEHMKLFTPESWKRLSTALAHTSETGIPYRLELETVRKDGSNGWMWVQGEVEADAAGNRVGLWGAAQDITERKRSEQALRAMVERYRFANKAANDVIWDWDVIQNTQQWNEAGTTVFGWTEIVEHRVSAEWWVERVHPDDRERVHESFFAVVDSPALEVWHDEYRFRKADGTYAEVMDRGYVLRDEHGKAIRMIGAMQDITKRKRAEEALRMHQQQLEHIAHYDILTTLPNRALLADRLRLAMIQAQRRQRPVAVALLDLDGFKAVNDQYGHETGDRLLIAVATRMKQALREGDTLARLGGDEFVAVLPDLSAVADCVPLLTRLLAAAAAPVPIGDLILQVSASIGVTFYPQMDEADEDRLLRQADQTMYQAKLAGKNRYYLFDAQQDRDVRSHHESVERIRRALVEHELVLHYQPKANLRTGTIVGAEALIRWQHPEKGLLSPALFLPPIAHHPLAIEIGEWVLETAMTQIEDWKAAGLTLPVSVNIDAIQLKQPDFVDRLRHRIAAHPTLAAGDLELEVLETSALEDTDQVSSVLLACREMGVGFALDDFGTGYASLTYLKRLPAGILKIDRSFVRDMLDDPDDLAILNGILGLANAFRSQTIAEGMETLEHGEILLQLGCELAQGYAIARPMPAADMADWLATWRPAPSWLNQAPISRDDLPILFAWVEHRAWILRMVRYIQGESDTPPIMHHEQCRVSQWMNIEVRLRREHRLAIESLEALHIEIHELASEMIRLKQKGQTETAIARLSALYRLRDRLLARFMEMLRHSRTAQATA